MDAPSLLLAGLRLNKALQNCAPEEYTALAKPIEKLLESASIERPPGIEEARALTSLFTEKAISGAIRDLEKLDEALDEFFDALFRFTMERKDISELCFAISFYRSRINLRA